MVTQQQLAMVYANGKCYNNEGLLRATPAATLDLRFY
jgi:hypothetical protein